MAVQHSSDSAEHYTPAPIVEAARQLMGSIDVDPASCALAQETVKAATWYGPGSPTSHDGLCTWPADDGASNVFLNPPGGKSPEEYTSISRSQAAAWWAIWSERWAKDQIRQMVFVGFTLEILRSVQHIDCPQPLNFPLCVPKSRIDFETFNRKRTKGKKAGELIDPRAEEGARVKQGAPGHANVIIWLPPTEAGRGTNALLNPDAYENHVINRFHLAFASIGGCRT